MFPLSGFAANALDMMAPEMQSVTDRLRERIVEVVSAVPGFPQQAMETLASASPDGSASWYFEVLLHTLAYIAVGLAVGFLVKRWGRQHFAHLYNPTPRDRSEKLAYLLTSCALMLLNVIAFVMVTLVMIVLFDTHGAAARDSQLLAIGVVAAVWTVHIAFRNLLAPDAASHRMLNIDDASARSLHHAMTLTTGISTTVLAICTWMDTRALDQDAHLVALIGGMLLTSVLLSAVAWRFRQEIAQMMLGSTLAESHGGFLKLVVGMWHNLAILFFFGAWLTSSVRLLLDLPSALVLVFAPVLLVFLGVGGYGILLLLIDKLFVREVPENPPLSASGDDEPIRPLTPDVPQPFKQLFERVAGLVTWVLMLGAILYLWGVDVTGANSLFPRAADLFITVALVYFVYQSARAYIDQKIQEEGEFVISDPGEESSMIGASRMATILPLIRNFLLITVMVIGVIMVLSGLGVDVAPLFAGAGVVGLAIGFGAQTLIRDIFSGAFFLWDDAFRLGEYVDVSGTRGRIEKISLRSMQLRHHLGAVHTIPFGEIKQLTNQSRDWAMMKLELRVKYDTDVEYLRKRIKKLGKELLDHPEVGGMFLQPLKCQGVNSMEDSAMIVRVKFMTRPGEQYQVRKVVYAQLRELFEKEQIEFAHREVTVRVADDGKEALDGVDSKALAGAVIPTEDVLPPPKSTR